MKSKEELLIKVLMNPSESKEKCINFGIVNEYKARFLAKSILSSKLLEVELPKKKEEYYTSGTGTVGSCCNKFYDEIKQSLEKKGFKVKEN